ncbi:ABC transporter permease [Amycolatopsis orientalis]|uniref:ABC transporter permease n=1 Tax=Amycolatopsis orientalis TaxID=31958 RepID=A0A193CA16_AMYOR|nr:ABC transporter permease [Amycolatopsis orientalis]ANN21198.1 ABC transporter permease [Amycolatopsis orientalis]
MTATLDRPAPAAGPATGLVGTWQLTRLALRRDRVVLPIWIVLLGIAPSSTAGTFETLYPTAAERAGLTTSMGANPSIAVIYGPAFDLSTAGGFTAWRLGGFLALLVALMAVFTVTRHTRAEEDSGRAELLASAVVGRYSALTAAVLVAGGASVLIGLIETALMIGAKMPSAGAFALGGATAATGLVFTAVAAVAVQVAEYSRTANGIGAAAVGVAFLLRAVGDSTADAGWVSWLSPIGWAQQLRPFADERWWVLLLPLAAAVVVGGVGYALIPRRDVGTGLLPPRPGPAEAAASLRSPFALAWRLHRGPLIGWLIGTAICAGVFGSVANGISDIVGQSEQARQIFQRMGGTDALVDAFMAAMTGMFAMVVALYGVQAALRIRVEETAIRVEPLLATGVGRLRVLGSHLVFAFGGTALMMVVSGVLLGLSNGMRAGDVGGSVGDLVVASLAQLPAVWVIVGLAVTLFGLAPKYSTAAWAIAGLALLLSLFGPVLNLPRVLLDASPFSHVPKLPAAEFTATPLIWLAGVAAVALAAGVTGWRRRDVG